MIKCPSCGYDLPDNANFCVNCGSRMTRACFNCGAAYQAGNLYCHACGARLGTGAPAAPPPPIACPRCQASNEAGTTFCFSCGFPLGEPGTSRSAPAGPVGVPAGFWVRLLAWFIDSILLIAFQLLLLTLMPGTSVEAYYSDEALWAAADSIMVVVGAVYYTVGVSVYSTTLGKRALGLYVLRRDGTKVSGLRAFGRHVATGLSALLLFAGYLMIAISSDKRGLHDHICDTVVVRR